MEILISTKKKALEKQNAAEFQRQQDNLKKKRNLSQNLAKPVMPKFNLAC